MNRILLFCFLSIAALAGAAQAQVGYVDFYEYTNFGGHSDRIYVNDGIENLDDHGMSFWDDWNDEISSLAVYGSINVRIYEHANYTGDYVDITGSVYDLYYYYAGNWNDRVSSIWVYEYPQLGWYYDDALRSDLYWDNDWFYHNNGLGWLWAGYYNRIEQAGWLYDGELGYLYTDSSFYPWFWSEYGYFYYYYEGSYNPRFFWNGSVWIASYGY
ncbi:MAG: peptidase inhibitor family I36 protein [Verrucomicrobiota bacterium]|nr:peptidase inhibitor family I36 protein [Verrucomicrobiota bacterium]